MVRVPLPARVPPNRLSEAMVDGSGPVSSSVAAPTARLAPSSTSRLATDALPVSSVTAVPAPRMQTCEPGAGSVSAVQLSGSFQSPLAASPSQVTGVPAGSQPAAEAGTGGRASVMAAAARAAMPPSIKAPWIG